MRSIEVLTLAKFFNKFEGKYLFLNVLKGSSVGSGAQPEHVLGIRGTLGASYSHLNNP